ncbi:MAG: His/Gly/Thr/Pro-type tRNA ligase C-terminal domain-containing protein, partial [Eubacteriales bacterium]|nr:His/Gly/Thr/Pro-type tRNA ligase C-terminal domain-containing protein [Eubacteriales bacterium]
APVQVKILPIADKHNDYSSEILGILKDKGLRGEVDNRNEKIGYKIREARMEKVPYIIVIGDRELEERTAAARSRKDGELGSMKLEDFIKKLEDENRTRALQ